MRRFLAILLLFCLLFPVAQAETIICPKCKLPHEVTYLQTGDMGIAVEGLCKALARTGYLPNKTKLAVFNDTVLAAVKQFQQDAGLPVTGQADDETLSLLLHGMSSTACKETYSEYPDQLFWVPTDGGKRVHIKACCSDMYDPRAISLLNALAMQIEPCGKCARKYREFISWPD